MESAETPFFARFFRLRTLRRRAPRSAADLAFSVAFGQCGLQSWLSILQPEGYELAGVERTLAVFARKGLLDTEPPKHGCARGKSAAVRSARAGRKGHEGMGGQGCNRCNR